MNLIFSIIFAPTFHPQKWVNFGRLQGVFWHALWQLKSLAHRRLISALRMSFYFIFSSVFNVQIHTCSFYLTGGNRLRLLKKQNKKRCNISPRKKRGQKSLNISFHTYTYLCNIFRPILPINRVFTFHTNYITQKHFECLKNSVFSKLYSVEKFVDSFFSRTKSFVLGDLFRAMMTFPINVASGLWSGVLLSCSLYFMTSEVKISSVTDNWMRKSFYHLIFLLSFFFIEKSLIVG